MIPLPRVRFSCSGLLVGWGLIVASGIFLLEGYAAQGEAGSPPFLWPEASLVRREAKRSTLLIFLHPQCPCSEASIEELRFIRTKWASRSSPCTTALAHSSSG